MRSQPVRLAVTGSRPFTDSSSARALTALLACSLLFLVLSFSWPGIDRARAEAPLLEARSWVLADAADGSVLTGFRRNLRLPMASTTKLMTAYLAIRELPLKRRVVAPDYPADPVESVMGLEPGQRVSVRDLLYGLIMLSGNDAAVALAEAVSGSTEAFVRQMNRTARSLGLDDTRFANPIGLDSPGHYSTASDLTKLARILLRIDSFRRISAAREAELTSYRPPRPITTMNDFLLEVPWATGVKTGRTLGAGYVLVSSATRDGVSLVGTVIGTSTESSRDSETIRLMRYGFSLFESRQVTTRGEVVTSVPLRYGGGELDLVAGRSRKVALRKDQALGTVIGLRSEEVEGPVKRGAVLGRLAIFIDGQERGSVALRAARRVAAPTLPERVLDFLGGYRPYLVVGLVLVIFGVALGFRIRSRRVRKSVRRIGRGTR